MKSSRRNDNLFGISVIIVVFISGFLDSQYYQLGSNGVELKNGSLEKERLQKRNAIHQKLNRFFSSRK